MVKFLRDNTLIFVVLIILSLSLIMAFNKKNSSFENEKIDNYYIKQLNIFRNNILVLKALAQKNASLPLLKKQFYKSRIAYKKMAVLSSFFNINESRLLNGAPVIKSLEDTPELQITPEGLQVIEQVLFDNYQAGNSKKITLLVNKMQNVLYAIETEIDRKLKFKNELVWDALRSALVEIVTKGITGFDSPIANYSLPEAIVSLEGIKELLGFFKKELEEKDKFLFNSLIIQIDKSVHYIQINSDFNKFDRINFIVQYINPLYRDLNKMRVKAGIGIPEGSNPINFNAESIFDTGFLNINFYAPGKDYWPTSKRIEIGRLLFSDQILSGTSTRSCASCHQPEKAFTDGLAKPFALDNKTLLSRNTPTLLNAGLQSKQFFDSRTDILENQLGEVVHNVEEMKGSLKKTVAELQNIHHYNQLFKEAYPDVKESITTFTIANAISSYIRTLKSFNSRFDQYMRGDKTILSATEKNGFNLFAGKAKCATCHYIPLFNGLVPPVFSETESEVIGVPRSLNKKPAVLDDDSGKYNFTKSKVDNHSFKIPTLRNIALTAPYMHNGVYNTLEEVMEFYNNGGGKGLKIAPSNQTLPFDKLNLSKKEITEVIAFMRTLTDTAVSQH